MGTKLGIRRELKDRGRGKIGEGRDGKAELTKARVEGGGMEGVKGMV